MLVKAIRRIDSLNERSRMAKSKRAVALFEVIQSSRTSRRGISDVLSTPKWWFKRRPGASVEPDPSPQASNLPPTAVITTAPAPQTHSVDLRVEPKPQRLTF